MSEQDKELAYLRGLYVEPEWTQRFTDFFDKQIEFENLETFTYLNAGVGNHTIELSKNLDKETEIFPICENEELQQIAQGKALATKTEIDFSTSEPLAKSEFVLADLSLVKPKELKESLAKASELSHTSLAFFLPTAGSFGEIFSYLWEVFLDLDLTAKGGYVEKLITEIPTISQVKDISKKSNLHKLEANTSNEVFEFENGEEFIKSPLIEYFFLPNWLNFLEEKEKEQVIKKLAQKIDDECDDISFRFSVKATLVTGERKSL